MPVRGDRHEEVAVAHCLGEDESRVEDQRGQRGKDQLGLGVLQAFGGHGEPGQHQAHPGQGDHRRERRTGTGGVERDQSMPQRTDQQTQPDDAVEGDHHRREHRVARIRRRPRPAAGHQHDDHADLDDGDRDGQDERTERLADPVRDHLRVVHRGEHRTEKACRNESEHHGVVMVRPCRNQDHRRHQGNHDGPVERSAPHRPLHGLTVVVTPQTTAQADAAPAVAVTGFAVLNRSAGSSTAPLRNRAWSAQ